MPRVPPADVREHIALFLQGAVKDYEIEGVCDRLGMPPAGPGAWSYNSKRVYVQNRLAAVSTSDLWQIARGVIDEFGDDELEEMLAADGFRGVDGELKNLIFAAAGPKPRIVLRDAIDNVIEIVDGADRCLVYDRPLLPTGLSWGELVDWWAESAGTAGREAAEDLFRRLRQSLMSPPEKVLFNAYGKRYAADEGQSVPALVPQVYLHYDPYSKREIAAFAGRELPRQRMDFLLLPNDRARIVIEVDGKQHYSDEAGVASPSRYAELVREDRSIALDGYDVFRFGGAELQGRGGEQLVDDFFDRLLRRYRS